MTKLFEMTCLAVLLLGVAVAPAFAENDNDNRATVTNDETPSGNSNNAGFGIGTAYQTNHATPDNSVPARPETTDYIGLGNARADLVGGNPGGND